MDKLFTYENKITIESAAKSNIQVPRLIQKNDGQTYESLISFLKDKGFKTDTDLVLGIAYYICKFEGKENFTSNDIKEALKKSKKPSKMNIPDKINKNIAKGFFEETGEKIESLKLIRLLDMGEDFVENYKSDEVPASVKKNIKAKAKPLTEIEIQIIDKIKRLDNYNAEDINNLKQIKLQKHMVFGAIQLISKTYLDCLFNTSIIYEFLRFLGLNVEKKTISARISEVKNFFDKDNDSGLLRLSNYGRVEIDKILAKEDS